MKPESISFSDLIEQYEIAIPMIQRDYAQGREDENAEKIRGKLLNKINLDDKKPIKFDFIYGYIEERDEREIFIPLDGQQRLTTLFLLHWYIAAKADKKDSTDKTNLKKFRYETRTSSTYFTQALVDNIDKLTIPSLLPAEEDKKSKKNVTALSEAIKNSAWFFTSWENDPTIAAMLVMLDAIHERNITKNKLEKITFDFINMGDFKLSDDLYLKMNARGVQLTPFENFKAFFEKHLEKIDDDLKNDERNSLKKPFTNSIDNKWLDTFWDLKYTEPDAIDKSYRTIDKPFMRFFWYMTEMLYFKRNKKTSNDIPDEVKSLNYNTDLLNETFIETVYSSNDEVKYLFKILDEFETIKKLCDKVLSSEYKAEKVALFTTESNLLEKLVKKGQLTNTERLILFTIMNYAHENLHENSPKNHLHDLVRVVRNLLFSLRKKIKDIQYTSSLVPDNYHKILKFILENSTTDNIYFLLNSGQLKNSSIFPQYAFEEEQAKATLIINNKSIDLANNIAKMEDHYSIKGATYNFKLKDNHKLIPEMVYSLYKTWKDNPNDINDSEIIRAFLTIGDYKKSIKWSVLGVIYFLGNKKHGGWNFILTTPDDKFSAILLKFLNESSGRTLQDITNDLNEECVDICKNKGWHYYFIKYSDFTSTDYNLFSFMDDDGFLVRNLSTNSAGGSHINPYLRTLARIINKKYSLLCHEDTCKSYDGIQNFKPLLVKINDLEITVHCKEGYWEFSLNKEPTLEIKEKFDLKAKTENTLQNQKLAYHLEPTEDKDMIEIAVEFISALYQLENPSEQKESEISSDFSPIS